MSAPIYKELPFNELIDRLNRVKLSKYEYFIGHEGSIVRLNKTFGTFRTIANTSQGQQHLIDLVEVRG